MQLPIHAQQGEFLFGVVYDPLSAVVDYLQSRLFLIFAKKTGDVAKEGKRSHFIAVILCESWIVYVSIWKWCRWNIWHKFYSDTLHLFSMDVLITWFELMQSRIGTTHLARSVCAAPTHPHVVILFTCLFPGPQMAVVNGTLMAEVARTSLLILSLIHIWRCRRRG